MSFGYTPAKVRIASGQLDWREAGADIRVILAMSNTTADTEKNVAFVGDLSVLDEYDGENYARKVLAGQAVNEDDENFRAELDADDVTWLALGVGTRQAVGMIIYHHVGEDDNANPILFYIDSGGFPFDGNGGTITQQWNVEGLAQVKDA
jgi:hypothetical protein